MRTDEIAPRVTIVDSGIKKSKTLSVLNPAFGAIFCALIAGMKWQLALQTIQAGKSAEGWLFDAFFGLSWFVLAIVGVLRGLRKNRDDAGSLSVN